MRMRRQRRESFLPDPSPEDIRRETAAIRQGWSTKESERRSHFRTVHWTPPTMRGDAPELSEAEAVS